jgi:hypothetical protein
LVEESKRVKELESSNEENEKEKQRLIAESQAKM